MSTVNVSESSVYPPTSIVTSTENVAPMARSVKKFDVNFLFVVSWVIQGPEKEGSTVWVTVIAWPHAGSWT